MARTNELDENVNEASSYFIDIGFLLLERANMEKCISIALTTQDNAKMELLRGMASLAGTFYFFIYSAINRNNFFECKNKNKLYAYCCPVRKSKHMPTTLRETLLCSVVVCI